MRTLANSEDPDDIQRKKYHFYLENLNSDSLICIHNGSLQVNCIKPGPEVIKRFPCSTQLSTKIILLINVKMPTIVGILTLISMINTASESLKAINSFICRYFSFYEKLKFRAQLSCA